MTNEELSDRISLLEAEIEQLASRADGCLKIILIAKIAIICGGLALLATVTRLVSFDQIVLVGSIAAILGGIVAAGSNRTTLRQVRGKIRTAEQLRNALIDRLVMPDRGSV
ncbi:MAG: hypothetical protein R3D62_10435 [Xanthobacteraceae bacterium]